MSIVITLPTYRPMSEILLHNLRQTDDILFDVLESTGIGVSEWNAKEDLITLSPLARQLFGWPANRAFSMEDYFSLLHPDDAEAVKTTFSLVQKGREVFNSEFRLKPANGEVRWIASQGRCYYNEAGELAKITGIIFDITARKNTEFALIERESDLRRKNRTLEILKGVGNRISAQLELEKAVQTITDAATELSGAEFGAFFYNVINQEGEAFMLYTLSGAPKEAFAKFPHPRNTQVFAPTFRGEGTVRSDDITKDPRYGKNAPRKGMPEGHLPVKSYLAVPVISKSGEVIGGIFLGHKEVAIFDEECKELVEGIAAHAAIVMDNARMFEALRKGEQQLKQKADELAASNAELNDFASVVSHDLKSPLRAIGTMADFLMIDNPELQEEERVRIKTIKDRVKRMELMIQGILEYSRLGRGKVQKSEVNSADVLKSALSLLQPGADIVLKQAASLPVVPADPVQLQQVFLNLVDNAIKYMPEGRGIVEIGYQGQHNGEHHFFVKDNGMGIDPNFHSRIFRIFQTLSPRDHFESTGIGLTIVQRIIQNHGGSIRVESEPGNGATFHFTLPC